MKAARKEYIKITLPLTKPPAAEQKTVESFNRFFPAGDAYIEIIGNNATLHLKQINFAKLEDYVKSHPTELAKAISREIAGIKSYNIRGPKRIYANYAAERKVKQRKQKEQKRDKIFYARGHGFSPRNTEVPADFTNRIICGDSACVLQSLPDNCVDLIFTSPPYNFGLEYQENDDDYYWREYFKKLFAVFDQCIRVLKFGGRIAVNIQPLFSRLYTHPPYHQQLLHAEKAALERRNPLGKKQLQLQIYGLGLLEKPLQSLSKIYLGVY